MGKYSGTLLYECIIVHVNQYASKKILELMCDTNKTTKTAGSIFALNMSHCKKGEKKEGDDDPSAEFLKQLMTTWQEYHSISEKYFTDKIIELHAIDHNSDNTILLLQLVK